LRIAINHMTETAQKHSGKKIARVELLIPETVSIILQNNKILVKGPKGDCERSFSERMSRVSQEDSKLIITSDKAGKKTKKLVKAKAAHIRNMIRGVQEGHHYTMKICSGHFPMNVSIVKDELVVKNFLGEKVPRIIKLKKGATVKVEGDKIVIESPNKEIAGQVSADIELLTKRANFDTRIFQDGIFIIEKDGKSVM